MDKAKDILVRPLSLLRNTSPFMIRQLCRSTKRQHASCSAFSSRVRGLNLPDAAELGVFLMRAHSPDASKLWRPRLLADATSTLDVLSYDKWGNLENLDVCVFDI